MKPTLEWAQDRISHIVWRAHTSTLCLVVVQANNRFTWRVCALNHNANRGGVLHSGTADTLEAAQLAAEQAARAVLQAELERLG